MLSTGAGPPAQWCQSCLSTAQVPLLSGAGQISYRGPEPRIEVICSQPAHVPHLIPDLRQKTGEPAPQSLGTCARAEGGCRHGKGAFAGRIRHFRHYPEGQEGGVCWNNTAFWAKIWRSKWRCGSVEAVFSLYQCYTFLHGSFCRPLQGIHHTKCYWL